MVTAVLTWGRSLVELWRCRAGRLGEVIERSGNTNKNKKRIQETTRRTNEMEKEDGN